MAKDLKLSDLTTSSLVTPELAEVGVEPTKLRRVFLWLRRFLSLMLGANIERYVP